MSLFFITENKLKEFMDDFNDWYEEKKKQLKKYETTPKNNFMIGFYRSSLVGSIESEYENYYKVFMIMNKVACKEKSPVKKRAMVMSGIIKCRRTEIDKKMFELGLITTEEDIKIYRDSLKVI